MSSQAMGETIQPVGDSGPHSSASQDFADALMDLLRLSRSFADSEMTRLSHVQYGILHRLFSKQESTLTAICEDLGYDLSVVSRQAAWLTEHGLVVRTKDPHDGRAWKISLTDLGRERFALARSARTALLTQALAPYSAAECETTAQVLASLNRVLAETLKRKGISVA